MLCIALALLALPTLFEEQDMVDSILRKLSIKIMGLFLIMVIGGPLSLLFGDDAEREIGFIVLGSFAGIGLTVFFVSKIFSDEEKVDITSERQTGDSSSEKEPEPYQTTK